MAALSLLGTPPVEGPSALDQVRAPISGRSCSRPRGDARRPRRFARLGSLRPRSAGCIASSGFPPRSGSTRLQPHGRAWTRRLREWRWSRGSRRRSSAPTTSSRACSPPCSSSPRSGAASSRSWRRSARRLWKRLVDRCVGGDGGGGERSGIRPAPTSSAPPRADQGARDAALSAAEGLPRAEPGALDAE